LKPSDLATLQYLAERERRRRRPPTAFAVGAEVVQELERLQLVTVDRKGAVKLTEQGRTQAAIGAVRRNPSPKVPAWAENFYRDFHWGDEADAVTEAQIPPVRPGETLVALGELVEVTYRARKDGQRFDWVHDFRRPRPMLTYQQSGQLIIIGGRYSVTPRGIVG